MYPELGPLTLVRGLPDKLGVLGAPSAAGGTINLSQSGRAAVQGRVSAPHSCVSQAGVGIEGHAASTVVAMSRPTRLQLKGGRRSCSATGSLDPVVAHGRGGSGLHKILREAATAATHVATIYALLFPHLATLVHNAVLQGCA